MGRVKRRGVGGGKREEIGVGVGFPPPPPFSSFTLTPTLRVTIFTLPLPSYVITSKISAVSTVQS